MNDPIRTAQSVDSAAQPATKKRNPVLLLAAAGCAVVLLFVVLAVVGTVLYLQMQAGDLAETSAPIKAAIEQARAEMLESEEGAQAEQVDDDDKAGETETDEDGDEADEAKESDDPGEPEDEQAKEASADSPKTAAPTAVKVDAVEGGQDKVAAIKAKIAAQRVARMAQIKARVAAAQAAAQAGRAKAAPTPPSPTPAPPAKTAVAPKARHPVAKVKVAGGSSTGGCDKTKLRAAIGTRVAIFRACYQVQLIKNPGLKGDLKLQWLIDADGGADNVEVTSASLKDAAVSTCVKRAIGTIRFKNAEGGMCFVQWRLQFSAT